MAVEIPNYATLAISPNTLSDLTVTCDWHGPSAAGGSGPYTLADAVTDHASYPGYLVIGLSMFTESILEKADADITISSTGCQTQTLLASSVDWYEITMEPAPGYKKMYAWDDGNWYTESATPGVGDKVYNYNASSDKYVVNGTITAVSTDTINIQSFT